jgi:hypothetical protein
MNRKVNRKVNLDTITTTIRGESMSNQNDVWVCCNNTAVYVSRSDAIRSAERMARKHALSAEATDAARAACANGRYLRADFAPAPCGLGECVWTKAALRRRRASRAPL